MKKTTLFSLSLLALASQSYASQVYAAETQSHRLAFSKAENVEVFVDHAANTQWCSPSLTMRFAFGTPLADVAAVKSLLPKLGVLLDSQCPAAEDVKWQAVNNAAKQTATGVADKAGAWQAQVDSEGADKAAAEQGAADKAATQQAAADKAASDKAAAGTVAAEAKAAVDKKALVAEPAADKAAADKAAADKAAADKAAADKAEADKAAADKAEADKAAAKAKEAQDSNAVFSVNGWQPKAAAEVFATEKAFQELTDSNGCKFRFSKRFDLGQQPYEFTSNAECDAQGYAQGKATVKFVRSDGKVLHNSEHFFVEGVPFGAEHALALVDSNQEGELIFLLKAEQASKYYYLLKAGMNYNGNWYLNQDTVYLLTEKKDDFRKAEPIRLAMLTPIPDMVKLSDNNSRFHVLAITDLNEAVFERNQQHYLYQGYVNKPWRSDWTFDPNRSTNYLFQNEARVLEEEKRQAQQKAEQEQREAERLAYEKKIELERKAREANNQLDLYQSYVDKDNDFDQILSSHLVGLDFRKDNSREYQAVIAGRSVSYQQVVHITKEQDGEFWTDYPYQAAITQGAADVKLQKGWYFISGKQTVDTERKDDQKFYLTTVVADTAYPCSETGCEDFFTPLNLVRLELNDPNWTVKQAEQDVLAAQEATHEH